MATSTAFFLLETPGLVKLIAPARASQVMLSGYTQGPSIGVLPQLAHQIRAHEDISASIESS